MEKSTKIGIIAGVIAVIYNTIVTILGACGVISFNLGALLILTPILAVAVFTLVFIVVKFITDFG